MVVYRRSVPKGWSRPPAWPHQYKLGLVVGSHDPDEFVGAVSPAAWKECGISSFFSAESENERDDVAIAIARQIGKALGLKVEDAFFVLEISDNHNQRRAVVCLVVTTTAPLKKMFTPLYGAKYVLNRDALKVELIEALNRALSGQPPT